MILCSHITSRYIQRIERPLLKIRYYTLPSRFRCILTAFWIWMSDVEIHTNIRLKDIHTYITKTFISSIRILFQWLSFKILINNIHEIYILYSKILYFDSKISLNIMKHSIELKFQPWFNKFTFFHINKT